MTTYATGNPIGSTEVKDLFDNAQNLDNFINNRAVPVFDDRLGVPRKTWAGIEEQAQVDIAAAVAEATEEANSARDTALTARDTAVAAAGAIGPIKFYATYAEAEAALAGLAQDDLIEVAQDEEREGARTRYRVDGGALVFVINLDQLRQDLKALNGANIPLFTPDGVGAVSQSIQAKLRENRRSVTDDGADAEGVINATAAFTNCRAKTGGYYFIPNGEYLLDPAFDVFKDCFSAGDNVKLIISGTEYNVSNSFAGALCWRTISNVLTAIVHAVTGATIVAFQNGEAGTATYFYRGLAVRTNSHFMQVKPATNGGSTDLLIQRSDENADPNGNRFALTFEEIGDLLSWGFATSDSGAPNFDTFMAVKGGSAPELEFPAIYANFRQGLGVQARSGGAFAPRWEPYSSTEQRWTDGPSGNVLARMKRSAWEFAGVSFETLLDLPTGVTGPYEWARVFSDIVGPSLPAIVPIWSNTAAGATRNTVLVTAMICASTSGGGGGARVSQFLFNGSTTTETIIGTDTLPAGFTVGLSLVGGTLRLEAGYSGAVGPGYTASIRLSVVPAAR